MSLARVAFAVLAVAAVLAAAAVLVAATYGNGGVVVENVTVTPATPTNATANCEDVVVRSASVAVTVSRPSAGLENPQFWGVGVTVRASLFAETTGRTVSVAPDSRTTVRVPFSTVREGSWAPREFVDAVVQVSQGGAVVAERTKTVSFTGVKAGQSC